MRLCFRLLAVLVCEGRFCPECFTILAMVVKCASREPRSFAHRAEHRCGLCSKTGGIPGGDHAALSTSQRCDGEDEGFKHGGHHGRWCDALVGSSIDSHVCSAFRLAFVVGFGTEDYENRCFVPCKGNFGAFFTKKRSRSCAFGTASFHHPVMASDG